MLKEVIRFFKRKKKNLQNDFNSNKRLGSCGIGRLGIANATLIMTYLSTDLRLVHKSITRR